MEEKWVLIKKFDTVHKNLYLPNDEIWISDSGHVKFNDTLLSLEYGLYISSSQQQYDILIPEFRWPSDKLYRLVYNVFGGKLENKQHIHHVDGNHLNNSIDNLIQLSVREHRKIHKDKAVYYQYENIYDIINKSLEGKDKFVKYLKERYKIYIAPEKHLQKQKEIEEKLASGLFQYNKNGTLCRKTTAKKGYVTPEDVRKKQSISIKKLYDESSEYRAKHMSGKGCKYIKDENGKKHRVEAA